MEQMSKHEVWKDIEGYEGLYQGKKHWNYKNGKYVKVEVTNEH